MNQTVIKKITNTHIFKKNHLALETKLLTNCKNEKREKLKKNIINVSKIPCFFLANIHIHIYIHIHINIRMHTY